MFKIIFLLTTLSPSLESPEINLIERCLKSYLVRPEELSFEKKWAVDSIFLLKRVATSLDFPLWLPFYADSTIARIKKISNELEIEPEESPKEKIRYLIEKLIPLAQFFTDQIQPLYPIRREKPSPEELDYLLYYSPHLFSDEEDTTDDYLKGYIHQEFSLPIKFDSTRIPSDSFFTVVKKINHQDYLSPTSRKRLLKFLAKIEIPKEKIECPGVKGKVHYFGEGELGKVVIGSEEDNLYFSPFDLIIDLGGNDIYFSRNSALGSAGLDFSALIDLSGNDFYYFEKPFSFGSAFFGTSILLDLKGNDTYRAGEFSLGSALFGLGILFDLEGDDFYEGKTFTQGSGFYGLGLLIDLKGNDTYRAYNFAQGFGSTFGYGALLDFAGNDNYYAGGKFYHEPLLPKDFRSFAQGFAIGFRPDAGGGIGLLYDRRGNDFYNGDVFGQGASYWYAIGLLFDEEGNDHYLATEYAQGAGIHLSSGILIDRKGNDHYHSRLGPGQGEGHDFSVGILIDEKGNDYYSCSGGQGIGLTNSFGLFLDKEGDDNYFTREKDFGQGWANPARGFGGFGIFLDLGGNDIYPREGRAFENSHFFSGFYGVGLDQEGREEKELEKEEELEDLKEKPIEEIFKKASEWEVGSAKPRVRAARKELIERDTLAIKYIFSEKIATKSGLELRAIEELCESLPEKVKQYLFQYLWDERREARANVIYLLGKLKVKEAVDSLTLALKPKRINKKVIANRPRWILSALGDIAKFDSLNPKGDSLLSEKVTQVILKYLKDKSEPTRLTAIVALGKIREDKTIPHLVGKLSDPLFTVRQASENALGEMGEEAIAPLLNSLKIEKKPLVQRGIISALGRHLQKVKDEVLKKEIRKNLVPFLASSHSEIRFATISALKNFMDEYTENLLKVRLAEETDPIVSDHLKGILEKGREK